MTGWLVRMNWRAACSRCEERSRRDRTPGQHSRARSRAPIEVELARDAEARITQRRHGTGLLVALRAPTARALLDDVIALGRRADELAANDPPHAPDTVATDLREHSTVAAPGRDAPRGRLLEPGRASELWSGSQPARRAVPDRARRRPSARARAGCASRRFRAVGSRSFAAASRPATRRRCRCPIISTRSRRCCTRPRSASTGRTDTVRPAQRRRFRPFCIAARPSRRSAPALRCAPPPGRQPHSIRGSPRRNASSRISTLPSMTVACLALIAAPVFMRRTRERLIRDRHVIDGEHRDCTAQARSVASAKKSRSRGRRSLRPTPRDRTASRWGILLALARRRRRGDGGGLA